MPKLKGTYFCPCLNTYVTINNDSVKEIINHACINDISTKLALNSIKLIESKKAKIIYIDEKIKKGNQSKRFHLNKMFVIKSEINLGVAKLTIGLKRSGNYIQYCITNFK